MKFKLENGFCVSQKEISQRAKKSEPSTRIRGLGEINWSFGFAHACLLHVIVKKSNAAKQNGVVSKLNPKIGKLKLPHDKTIDFQS